ncbi:MAG: L-seryl-tRNA(Sec) selenium transferase [Myxococcales bacterium]|jgi:L-seryl-tRNA(Ser) seleniumtransferase
MENLRKLPKMDRLLEHAAAAGWEARYGREPVLGALRSSVEEARARVLAGEPCPEAEAILESARSQLERESRPSLRPAINASGVIVHTNLGRAPLSEEAIAAMGAVARGYSTLEYDVEEGERGSRYVHASRLLAQLTGAEDGLVVNNNAAAVMLVLATFARDRQVVLSRGQLVEIGGGFRVPDVMRQSGAELVEVGTTNRTYVRDYEAAITERTAALMVVHRSNFQIVGFTHEPALEALAELAHRRGLLLIDDLGSGTLIDTAQFGLEREPRVQERIVAGADLVCFSGDKLLGGPQAGYIVGRRKLIERLKQQPLLRALRVDKVTLAGIEATLRRYQRGDVLLHLPVWRSISMPLEEIEARAQAWKEQLGLGEEVASVRDARSTVGGGSLPGMTLPTRALAVRIEAPDAFVRRLREGEPPVVARIEDDRVLFDPRTVMPHEDGQLVRSIRAALRG